MFWIISLCRSLTDNLQTAISMKLSYVSSAEPPLAFLIHKEVLTVLVFVLVVAHCYVWPTDQNLSSRTGPVCAAIATWIHTYMMHYNDKKEGWENRLNCIKAQQKNSRNTSIFQNLQSETENRPITGSEVV